MSYEEVVNLIIPWLAIVIIIENCSLKKMLDKDKLEVFDSFKYVEDAICLIAMTFIVCDLVNILSEATIGIWAYTITGFLIGIVIAIIIIVLISKYYDKKVKENE